MAIVDVFIVGRVWTGFAEHCFVSFMEIMFGGCWGVVRRFSSKTTCRIACHVV